MTPIAIEPIGPTQPQAGVIATRPATAPEAAPSIVGEPLTIHSASIHARVAAAVASNVFVNTSVAKPFASRFEPTLKPNQPTHSREAPIMTIGTLCGGRAAVPYPTRLPISSAPTRPAMPALMCTTVPPAKSRAPLLKRKPAFTLAAAPASALVNASGPDQNHTMCAIG